MSARDDDYRNSFALEHEVKLTIGPSEEFRCELVEHLFPETAEWRRWVTDIYLDTPESAIEKAGATLSIRSWPRASEYVHLLWKELLGMSGCVRHSLELATQMRSSVTYLLEERDASQPAVIRLRQALHDGDARLGPVLVVRQARESHRYALPDGHAIAVHRDHAVFSSPSAPSAGVEAFFLEIESFTYDVLCEQALMHIVETCAGGRPPLLDTKRQIGMQLLAAGCASA